MSGVEWVKAELAEQRQGRPIRVGDEVVGTAFGTQGHSVRTMKVASINGEYARCGWADAGARFESNYRLTDLSLVTTYAESPWFWAMRFAEQLRLDHIGGVYLYLGRDGDNMCELKDFSGKVVGTANSRQSLLEAIERAEADWRERKAAKKTPDKKPGPVDEATPEGHCAVDAACAHRCLDEERVPRADKHGHVFSLWGRVLEFVYASKATTKQQVSREAMEAALRAKPSGWMKTSPDAHANTSTAGKSTGPTQEQTAPGSWPGLISNIYLPGSIDGWSILEKKRPLAPDAKSPAAPPPASSEPSVADVHPIADLRPDPKCPPAAPPPPPAFAVGDTVRLNSGGPLMTVIQASPDQSLYCRWISESVVHNEYFVPSCVRKDNNPTRLH